MTKSVAILGCGPSGLLVAHAAAMLGWDFRIYSKKRKSFLFGSQYLHEPIPGMTDPVAAIVTYNLVGTAEGYRQKVYGNTYDGTVSPEDLNHDHYAWNIRTTYDKLWNAYELEIEDCNIVQSQWLGHNPLSRGGLFSELSGKTHDLVISTVPRKIWAQPGDVFASQKVWAIGDAPELGQKVPFEPKTDNTIICDGTSDIGWYRLSKVFGYTTIEWPQNHKPPIPGMAEVEKPLWHNSTAASDFIHLGRYGAWQKGVLTTDVFHQALNILGEDKIDNPHDISQV
ncbi:oxidoreductase [Mycobacterium phage Hawkeye]|uniref:Oxidoreductase n=1 Tax=Mycobacterium phage Hawkeye TaxID=1458711 RepID=X2KSQ4_9CAUD|nr:oxidoreductase [Mycobacterium phage Hawkeye]AHN84081.1 oxidoreductase [Mycobacterium phage Hawkeye]